MTKIETIKLDQSDKRVKFLDDRLEFDNGPLSRPYKETDASGKRTVFYEDIRHLSREPTLEPIWDSDSKRFTIYVPKVNRTVVFILESYSESPGQSLSQSLRGPYLAREYKLLIGLRYLARKILRK